MNAEIQLKRVTTSQLEIAYLESGAEAALPVVLVHGWPDDAMTWNRIVPDLTQHGFRTIAPYLRGFGPTRFLPSPLAKSAQLTALGQDLIEFTEQLGLERFLLVGHDWGARASYILSALKPERVRALVALSVGYGTNNPDQAIRAGAAVLVSLVLCDGARTQHADSRPPGSLPFPLGDLVTNMAFQRI